MRKKKKLTKEQILKRRESSKKYYEKNIIDIKAKAKALRQTPEWKEQNKLNKRKHRKEFKDEYNLDRRLRYQKYKQTNPHFGLICSIRSLITISIKSKGFIKKSKTENILGCTINDFIKHIENNFEPWMNWDNYGNWNGIPKERNVAWDIDHVIPISSGSSEEEIINLNHYSNLKPLCSYVNRYLKVDKIDYVYY